MKVWVGFCVSGSKSPRIGGFGGRFGAQQIRSGIPPQHLRLDPSQRRCWKSIAPFLIGNLGDRVQGRRNILRIGLKLGNVCLLGESLVPGADILANVAPCYPALEMGGDRIRNLFGAVFDRVVGDAAVGIDDEGGADRLGGASVEAAGAGAAVGRVGAIGGKLKVGQDFAQEDPGTILAGNYIAVFGNPAQSGAFCPDFVLDGTCVGVVAGFDRFILGCTLGFTLGF